jgi:hypothetical protein
MFQHAMYLGSAAFALSAYRYRPVKRLRLSPVIALTETAQFCSSKMLTAWLRR